MLKLLLAFLMPSMFLSLCADSLTPDPVVTFRLMSDTVPEGSVPHITGDHESLGMWDAAAVLMDQAKEGTWESIMTLDHGTFLNYKFTLGSWETEALLPDGTIPFNHLLDVRGDTTVVIEVDRWKQADDQAKGAEKPCSVTFRVLSETIPADGTVYIVGNIPDLGDWQPAAVPLLAIKEGEWSKTFTFASGTYIEYKFTLGSWYQEALRSDGTVPGNRWFTVQQDTVVTVDVPEWGWNE